MDKHRSSPAAGGALSTIFARLDDDWRRTSRSSSGARRLAEWAGEEEALACFRNLDAVVRGVEWAGYQARPDGQAVLSALLRLSVDPLAARALLQALLPRLRAERVATSRFGHGLDEHRQEPVDTMADLVAEGFAAIVRHAGEDRPDVGRLVAQEATRKLRTARQAQRRYQLRNIELRPGHTDRRCSGLLAARSSAEWVATALCHAVRAGRLSANEASLVYATRVKGLPASDVGRAKGLPPKAVYQALAKAEQAFVARAA